MNTIDITLTLFAALILNRVQYWCVIAERGFAFHTPVMFLRHPSAYQWISIILGIACGAVTTYSWYLDTLIMFTAMLIGYLQAHARAKATHHIFNDHIFNDTSIALEEDSYFGNIEETSCSAEPQQFESESESEPDPDPDPELEPETEPEPEDVLELGAFTARPFNKGLELIGRGSSERVRLYRSDVPKFIEYVQQQCSDS